MPLGQAPSSSSSTGRVCLSDKVAERAIQPIEGGRRNWTFVGSDAGDHRALAIYTSIESAKLNSADLQALLADILSRLPGHAARHIDDLLP